MENRKSILKILIPLLIVLTLALLVLLYLFFTQKKESEQIIAKLEEYSEVISAKKDSLESELKGYIVKYDSLMTDNDSMNMQLEDQQEKIKSLLSIRMNDAQKIREYEKELKTIREVLKSYIVQIDSLNTRNQILTAENIELRSKTYEVEEINKQLSVEKQELDSITTEAKTLVAANIEPHPLNNRSKDIDRFNKVEKIRVDFILRKNTITEPGSKVIYLRIIRPDELLLSSPDPGVIEVNGEEIPYSASREVIYENADLPVSIYWDNNGDLIPGNYQVELYHNGKLIGESGFTLTSGFSLF